MATKNICDVELLSEMTADDNVIVDHNGTLQKMNLQNEFNNIQEQITELHGLIDGANNVIYF